MNNKVRVRYAPSPTGYQHIGGVRTALFNYLFAKANNGEFILRIEDTDQTRYFDGALEDIFKTFNWLGIHYDEGPLKEGKFAPYFQSKRLDLYKVYAEELVQKGWAYKCYCDSARLERIKKIQEANKLPPGYDRHCRDLSKEEKEAFEKSGGTPVIRFKAPLDGVTSFEDKILGKIEVPNATLQDFVLLKSDGFPTYHLANIVDDHLMEITHVLRAQEWIPSTPNHILLYKAFGWSTPEFCHLPMVMGEDGQKLSKRHGSTHLLEFKNAGYLPEAIVNFIALLGWSFNDKDEVFSLEELGKIFNIERINKAPAVFNYKKLQWFNGLYIRQKTDLEIFELIKPYLIKDGIINENTNGELKNFIISLIPLIKERLELLSDAPELIDYMLGDIPKYRKWEAIYPKNIEKDTIISILNDTINIIGNIDALNDDQIKQSIYDLSVKYGVKAGAVFMPIRIALTGTDRSPELVPVIKILGRSKVRLRIEHAIDRIKQEK